MGSSDDAAPRSSPDISNVTIAAYTFATNVFANAPPTAVRLARGTAGLIRNLTIVGSPQVLDVDDDATCQQLVNGTLRVSHMVTAAVGRAGDPDADAPSCTVFGASPDAEAGYLASPFAARTVITDPFRSDSVLLGARSVLLPDLRIRATYPEVATAAVAIPADGFFEAVTLAAGVEAVNLGGTNVPWYSGWTIGGVLPPPPPAILRGIVTSPFRGAIADAQVLVSPQGRSARTDVLGRWEILGPGPGPAQVSVTDLPLGCTPPAAVATTIQPGVTDTIRTSVTCEASPDVALNAGAAHTCVLTRAGRAWCFGDNTFGQLGTGNTVSSSVPVPVAGDRTFIAITASHQHTCAIETAGALFCWGSNAQGQLGINSVASVAVLPTPVFAAQAWRQVSAGVEHTCAVDVFDEAYCWGSGNDGKLGNGGQATVRIPVPVSGGLSWRAVSAGGALTCGVTRAGVPYCWGSNAVGGLGNPSTTIALVPQAVQVAVGDSYLDIAAGESLACAVTTTAGGRCWGNNPTGQLGTGTSNNALTPQAVAGSLSWAVIASAAESSFLGHGCGVTIAGAVACWGLGDQGQLGRSATTTCLIFTTWPCTLSPQIVPVVPPASRVAVGVRHSCALTRDGVLWCWGANTSGQLGDGTTNGRSTPVPIAGSLDLPRIP